MKIAVSGSRYISEEALGFAKRIVMRAKEIGATILVGDNPLGVDKTIVNACIELGVPMVVYYTNGKSRLAIGHVNVPGGYAARDRAMADAADRLVAIWNGSSKGTREAFIYARCEKTIHTFKEQK